MKKAKGKRQKAKSGLIVLAVVLFGLIAASTATAQIASGGAFTLEKSVVAGGGGSSGGGAFSIVATAGQTAAGASAANNPFAKNIGFWTPENFAPTAAAVSVSGKVTTALRRGIRNAVVTLIDSSGTSRTVITGSFGNYRFADVAVGATYILTVASKRFAFADPTRVITVNEEIAKLDFIAEN